MDLVHPGNWLSFFSRRRTRNTLTWLLCWAWLLSIPEARAAGGRRPSADPTMRLQILHTNDLHSAFETYPRIRGMIQAERERGDNLGYPSIVLDAGDFTDGDAFFFADDGEHSFSLLSFMGYDAIALGNHDWLMGPQRLSQLIDKRDSLNHPWAMHPPILAANFQCSGNHALARQIRSLYAVEKDGIRIAILGLTTPDAMYSWRASPDCSITNPIDTVRRIVPGLKERYDLVVALSHLGLTEDQRLIANTDGIDLVVGGHSHTTLPQPVFVTNALGATIPIVQTGSYGENLGQIFIKWDPKAQPRTVELMKAHLIAVNKYNGYQEDSVVRQRIQLAEQRLREKFGSFWLDEPLAWSDAPLNSAAEGASPWGALVARAFAESANTEYAFIPAEFFGRTQPKGIVTRRKIMSSLPRVFEHGRFFPWNIYTADVGGLYIQILMGQLVTSGAGFSVFGMDLDIGVDSKSGKRSLRSVRMGGRPLDVLKSYRIALPEGLIRGGLASQPVLAGLAFGRPTDTRQPEWPAVEAAVHRHLKPYPRKLPANLTLTVGQQTLLSPPEAQPAQPEKLTAPAPWMSLQDHLHPTRELPLALPPK